MTTGPVYNRGVMGKQEVTEVCQQKLDLSCSLPTAIDIIVIFTSSGFFVIKQELPFACFQIFVKFCRAVQFLEPKVIFRCPKFGRKMKKSSQFKDFCIQ